MILNGGRECHETEVGNSTLAEWQEGRTLRLERGSREAITLLWQKSHSKGGIIL